MSKYKKLLLALAAIASLYLVKATGLDQGLIDEALKALVEAVAGEEESAPPAPPAPVEVSLPLIIEDDCGRGEQLDQQELQRLQDELGEQQPAVPEASREPSGG